MNQKLKNSVVNKVNNSYIEYIIFTSWRINVLDLIRTKASITKNFHISPNEIDNMFMWEYEMWIEALNDQITEENKEHEAESSKYDISKYQKMAKNPYKMMPKIPNMNFPKI